MFSSNDSLQAPATMERGRGGASLYVVSSGLNNKYTYYLFISTNNERAYARPRIRANCKQIFYIFLGYFGNVLLIRKLWLLLASDCGVCGDLWQLSANQLHKDWELTAAKSRNDVFIKYASRLIVHF